MAVPAFAVNALLQVLEVQRLSRVTRTGDQLGRVGAAVERRAKCRSETRPWLGSVSRQRVEERALGGRHELVAVTVIREPEPCRRARLWPTRLNTSAAFIASSRVNSLPWSIQGQTTHVAPIALASAKASGALSRSRSYGMCADWHRRPAASRPARKSATVRLSSPAPSTSRNPIARILPSVAAKSFGR